MVSAAGETAHSSIVAIADGFREEADDKLKSIQNTEDAVRQQVSEFDENLDKARKSLNDTYNDLSNKLKQEEANCQAILADANSKVVRAEQAVQKAEDTAKVAENFSTADILRKGMSEAQSYWELRADRSVNGMIFSVCVFVSWSIIAFTFLIPELRGYSENIEKANNVYDLLPGLSLNLLFVGSWIWIARIIVKLFLSQYHTNNGSREKLVMINTFLLLVESGKANVDEKSHMLRAIFQPSQDGVVQDDPPQAVSFSPTIGG